jgi:hypothetical protein
MTTMINTNKDLAYVSRLLRAYPIRVTTDNDDVLFPWMAPMLALGQEELRCNVALENASLDSLERILGCTTEQAHELIAKYHHTHPAQITPMPEALVYVPLLAKVGFDLGVITARPVAHEAPTRQLINHHFPGVFKPSHIHVLGNHYMDGGPARHKWEVCTAADISAHIDDDPRYIRDCVRVGAIGVLFGERSWSQTDVPGAYRARTWKDTFEYLTTPEVVKTMIRRRYKVVL